MERIRYRFFGHVQHRGFRYGCVMCAQKAQVSGWVRNERDGTVTAEVQGEKQGQLEFLRRLTDLVPGYGNDWTIASEKTVPLKEDERDFGVHRY